MNSPHSRTTIELAHRLLGTEVRHGDAPETVTESAERACERLARHLARWIGVDGTNALFARALVHAQPHHPALRNVRYSRGSVLRFEGLTESAQTHGTAAAAESVAGILTALIELLGRLIGVDLAMQLIEQSTEATTPGKAPSTGGEDAQ